MPVTGAEGPAEAQRQGGELPFEHARGTAWPTESSSPPSSHMVGRPRPVVASNFKGPRSRVRIVSDDGTFARTEHSLAALHGAAHQAAAGAGPRSGELGGGADAHQPPPSAMQTILTAVQSRHGHALRTVLRPAVCFSHCIPQALGSQRAAFVEETLRLESALAALQCHQEALRQIGPERPPAPPAVMLGPDAAAARRGSCSPQDRLGSGRPRGSLGQRVASPPPGWPSSAAPKESRGAPQTLARHAMGSGPSLTSLVQGGPAPEGLRHAVCSGPSLTSMIQPAGSQQAAGTGVPGICASMPASPFSQHAGAGAEAACSPPSLTFPSGVALAPEPSPARMLRPTLSLAEPTLTAWQGQPKQLGSRPSAARPYRVSTPSLLDVDTELLPSRPAVTRSSSNRLRREPGELADAFVVSLPGSTQRRLLPTAPASSPSSPGSPPHVARQFLRLGSFPAGSDGGGGGGGEAVQLLSPKDSGPQAKPSPRHVSWSGSETEIDHGSGDGSPLGRAPGGPGRLGGGRTSTLPGIQAARQRSPSPEDPRAKGGQAKGQGLHGLLSMLKQGLGSGSGTGAGAGAGRQLHRYKSVGAAAGAGQQLPHKPTHSSPDAKRPLQRGLNVELGGSSRAEVLTRRMELEASRLSHCEYMLGVYINRSNAAWAESQGGWAPATAVEQQELQDGEDMHIYKAELIRKLRLGQIVFQVFAAEDELALPEGGSLDLWTSDPWALVAAARPGSMPILGERMEGLSMGSRALAQLRMAVEEVAGLDAVAALNVVLHLHEGQREAVLKDLCSRRHYGFRPDNLFVTVQQRRPAYRYDPCENNFTPADADARDKTTHFSMGPGFGMLQLGWVADAFTLSDSGRCVALKETLLEHLQRRNVEWLISRRSCDLSLYSADGALDVAFLTQVLQLRQYARAKVVCQVTATPSIRQVDSLFVCRQSSANEAILISPFKHSKPVHTVIELRCCECSSAIMVDAVGQVKAEAGGELLAGLHRYAFHFPTLAAMLTNPKAFRPKLALEGSAVRVSLELSDLTSSPNSKCLAALAPAGRTVLLKTLKELEDLIPALQRQDQSPGFLKLAASARQCHKICG